MKRATDVSLLLISRDLDDLLGAPFFRGLLRCRASIVHIGFVTRSWVMNFSLCPAVTSAAWSLYDWEGIKDNAEKDNIDNKTDEGLSTKDQGLAAATGRQKYRQTNRYWQTDEEK